MSPSTLLFDKLHPSIPKLIETTTRKIFVMNFNGIFPILVTPFHPDESVDFSSLERLVDLMKKIGVDGVTILGVLGEANRLTDNEREEIIKQTVNAAGKMPVIVGTSAGGTLTSCNFSQSAYKLGASAVMVTPHNEPDLNESKIINHYHMISRVMPLPIVLQDHPASSGVQMPSATIIKLVENNQSIQCIKEEAVPTSKKIRALKQKLKTTSVLTGLGGLYGLFDLKAGSDGFNTGFAFPELLIALKDSIDRNEENKALELYQRFLPLIVFEQQPGVAIRKEILKLRQAISSSTVRAPGSNISPESRAELVILLRSIFMEQDLSKPISADWIDNLSH